MDRRQTAQWFGVSVRRLRKWLADGKVIYPVSVAMKLAGRNCAERRTPPARLCLTKDIMLHIKVSRSTVDRWRKRGCPHYDFGGSIRFVLYDVRRWRVAIRSRHPT